MRAGPDHDRHRRAARAARSPAEYGVRFVETALTRDNYRAVLEPLARRRRFPAQRLGRRVERRADRAVPARRARFTSTPASSRGPAAIPIRTCRPRRAPITPARERAGAAPARIRGGPTAVLTHGANPGLVSHFVKQALVDVARDIDPAAAAPAEPRRLGAARRAARGQGDPHRRARHAGRRRSRRSRASSSTPGRSTASISEGSQPAELGWGTHERHFPADGRRHDFGSGAAIYLLRPGAGDAGAQLDAARRPLSRLPDHPRRVDLDRRLPDGARGRHRSVTARPAITPITRATTRC